MCEHVSQSTPDNRGMLTKFNSTYVEFVGRQFRLRGSFGIMLAFICSMLSLVGAVCAPIFILARTHEIFYAILFMSFIFLIASVLFWWLGPRFDFFSHTYYPIRFNRRTRMIYVYRDSRNGGMLSVPWEAGFFHVGKGLRNKYLLDLRCHVLDGDVVTDTFAVGTYFDDEKIIRNLWAFICKYMDEGPDAVRPRYLMMSAKPTWKNCYIFVAGSMRFYSSTKRFLFTPILLLFAGFRWLVMVTCRPPVWPQAIEDACRIDENDPSWLPEPDYIGQFAGKTGVVT